MSGVRNESNFVFRADFKIQDLIKITKAEMQQNGNNMQKLKKNHNEENHKIQN